MDVLLTALAAVAQSPFGVWLAAAALGTTVTFFVTAAARTAIDRALGTMHSGEPLGLFDLSHGDAAGVMESKVAVAPERLWTYDDDYLIHFVKKAANVSARQRPALELYAKFVLPWDMAFAFFLASFVVLFWLAVATAPWAPIWLGRFALFAECMGILYGFADLGEDIKLTFIILDPSNIDPAEAAAANALTRTKFVAIVLSIVGALVFGVVSVFYDVARWIGFGVEVLWARLLWPEPVPPVVLPGGMGST
jgi:hypothetical protein